MSDVYKYYINYDEEADGYDVYAYDPAYSQFMFKGIFDNSDEAKEFAKQLNLKKE